MAVPVKMQRLSKVAAAGEVVEWLKSPGDRVEQGEPLLKALSEKATVEIEAPAAGVLLEIIAPAGKEVEAGAVLAWIGEPGERIAGAEAPPARERPAEATPAAPRAEPLRLAGPAPAGDRPKAAPAARRLARERGLDLRMIAGSGPGGIITRADVQAAAAPAVAAPAAAPMPELEPGARLESISGIQRVMLSRMTLNMQQVAQATTVAEVDMTEIAGLREMVPATYTAWVILAVARALGEYPILNASLYGDKIAYHPNVHAGVSVETEAGLIVPVIHNADKMGLAEVHRELGRLVEAARRGALQPEEVEGATITVTNSGVLGSVLYTPMIVPPQSAIVGMGRVARVPAVRDDQIVIRSMMYLCLSYDHRLIAGGTAVRYLQRVRKYLEAPATLVWQ